MTNATLTPAAGVGSVAVIRGSTNLARSLYIYENKGFWATTVLARGLYLYEAKGIWAFTLLARALYLYEGLGLWAIVASHRSLYLHEDTNDNEPFPWLMQLVPNEQVIGGQVDILGDGLGSIIEVGAAATLTASSTNGGNVPGNAVDRVQSTGWLSNDAGAAWIRFTWGTPQPLYAIALTSRVGAASWGVPLFRFSDAGADVVGGGAVVVPTANDTDTVHPYGPRTYYALPSIRTVTWVEVRVSSGSGGGLSEIFVYADKDVAAEDSHAFLRSDEMGIVAWLHRSPNLYPANSGVPILAAATVTVPPLGASGMVTVVENI